jgi:hypothetical protein
MRGSHARVIVQVGEQFCKTLCNKEREYHGNGA